MHEVVAPLFIDRAGWPAGPWDDEPDRIDWRDGATGAACFMRRGNRGAWCGYVAVPPGHPLHGSDDEGADVSAHGGLTFAGPCDEREGPEAICHRPRPGEPDGVWWFGFDCAHGSDVIPGLVTLDDGAFYLPGAVYRDVGYVREQCTRLAADLAAPDRHHLTSCYRPPAEALADLQADVARFYERYGDLTEGGAT